ncbi:unnamed protein product [Diatraea saccharalis]|uniref:Uridine diphosphate glucose pyrophosphatase NUDT14 n=1 Tax=Diatraea saccharalis TaxID=40085 RepID=A0A9N9R377_9NEOP|nr:unnamed protein product [Diatraea saccharalis]
MEDIEKVHVIPLPDSPYVKPFRLNYTQNGKQKSWDLLEVHDSVAIIVFNVTRKVMVFVKQFRPGSRGFKLEVICFVPLPCNNIYFFILAIYYNSVHPEDRDDFIDTKKYPASLGIALEMCAGIIDKDKPTIEIAKEEVLEECGYNVEVENLHKIMSYRSGVGVQGSLQTLYYCEVTDDMKTEQGGGVEDEIIEVVEMTIPQIELMLNSEGPLASPPSCLFALMWFLHNKADKYRK